MVQERTSLTRDRVKPRQASRGSRNEASPKPPQEVNKSTAFPVWSAWHSIALSRLFHSVSSSHIYLDIMPKFPKKRAHTPEDDESAEDQALKPFKKAKGDKSGNTADAEGLFWEVCSATWF